MIVHLSEYKNNTSVESVKLGKTFELSKLIRKSSPVLDRVNWDHRRNFLDHLIFVRNAHTKFQNPSTFPSPETEYGGGWLVVGVKSRFLC